MPSPIDKRISRTAYLQAFDGFDAHKIAHYDDRKFQELLANPAIIRNKLKIKPGAFLRVRLDKNNIVLTPMKKKPIDLLYGRFAGEKILDELEKEHAEEIERENRS